MSRLVNRHRSYSVEEYFEIELASNARHELRRYGRVVAMAGGTANHTRICMNLHAALRAQLRPKGCETFGSDLRIKAKQSTHYFYPDASVICGPADIEHWGRTESITNPIAIFGVLSPTTELYDRGDKFSEYICIESLKTYAVIEQHIPRVDVYSRNDAGEWLLNFMSGADAALTTKSPGFSVPFAELYEGVEFVPQVRDPREED